MSEHRDPFDLLDDFDAGAPMPVTPAAEIRRRGDRRRRRTTALVAAGAAAAVVAVAVPLSVLGRADDRAIEPALPTISAEVDLLDAAEVPPRSGLEPWAVDTEGRADDTGTLACAPGPVDDLGPQAQVSRAFVADVSLPPGTTLDPSAPDVPGGQAKEAVLEFADTQAAGSAYDEAVDWVVECPGAARAQQTELSDVAGDGARSIRTSWVLPAADTCGGDCDAARYADMAVTQVGDRLVLTSYQVLGGPVPPERLARSSDAFVEATTTKARPDVDTLEPDDRSTPAEPTEPATTGTGSEIPRDFPMIAGTFTSGESDVDSFGPSGSAPGVSLPGGFCRPDAWPSTDAVDRLAFTESGPEYSLSRELAVFSSADDAVAVLSALRAAVAACPGPVADGTPGRPFDSIFDQVDPDTGYDTVAFTRSGSQGAPGGDGFLFVRVGRAIFASTTYGEYLRSNVDEAVDALATDGTDVVAAMCAFSEAGC